MGVAISGLVAASSIAEADELEIEQSGISKKITKTQLRSLLFSDPAYSVVLPQAGDSLTYNGTDWVAGARGGWRTVPQAAYTEAAVFTSSSITFDGGATANGINLKGGDYFSVGDPVRVVISGSSYYGICTAVTDTLLSISGGILPTSTAITSLAVGTRDMVKHIDLLYPTTTYNTLGVTTPLAFGCVHKWRGKKGYLVHASMSHTGTSATTQVNLKMNAGTNVLQTNLTLNAGGASTRGTFVGSTNGTIIHAQSEIEDGEEITVVVPVAGGTANYLIACLTFIVP